MEKWNFDLKKTCIVACLLLFLLISPVFGEDVAGNNTVSSDECQVLPEITCIVITPVTAECFIGNTTQYQAVALDSSGSEISDTEFTWESSDETVGTVDSAGLFTALSSGTVQVSVMNGSVSADAVVTVLSVPESTAPESDESVDLNASGSEDTGMTTPETPVAYTAVSNSYVTSDSVTVSSMTVMPSNKDTLLRVSNDGTARFNDYGNNTYHFFSPTQSATQGMNALHFTTDVSIPKGQVTFSSDQSGLFYITDTGGRGWDDDGILLLAVNGTIPGDFKVHIRASGYQWAPVLTGTYPAFANVTYVPGALNETFTKEDFLYGPQIWRPCAAENFPIFDGQDMTDTTNTTNTFSILLIDLKAGILGANTLAQSDFSGQSITDTGAIKIEYSFENLESLAAFDGYAYTVSSNQGQGIRWTNRLSATGSSGYAVLGTSLPEALTANFTANVTSGDAPLTVQFTDLSTGTPTSWEWDFDNDGVVDSTGQNPVNTYTATGTYSVNLTVTNEGGTDSVVRGDYISVALSDDGSLLADTAWPKFSNNIANTGLSPYNGPQTNTTLWITSLVSEEFQNSNTGSSISYNAPAIGPDGTLYLGTREGQLNAVYPNGTIKWAFTTSDSIYGTAAISSDGTIYIGNKDGIFYAINPDGTEKWQYAAGKEVFSSPSIGSDGTVYFGSKDRYLYAINPNGTLKWKYEAGSYIDSSPAIGSDGTIYIGARYDGIYALNPDGSLKWFYEVPGYIRMSPAIGPDGTIYVGNEGRSYAEGGMTLYAIHPDGTLKWEYYAGLSFYFSSPAIGADGTVFIATNPTNGEEDFGMLYAITPDGTVEWTCTMDRYITGTPTLGADGTIYIESYDDDAVPQTGSIYAVNADGSIKWKYEIGCQTRCIPSIGSDGTLYCAAGNGNLYAFENVVDFTTDVTEGKDTLDVLFTGSSTRNIASWHWNFGDNTTSNQQNPSHSYSPSNTESYTITLTVTDTSGTSYTAKKPGYITVWKDPIAGFDVDLTAGQVPMTVNFTDTSVNTPTTWLWNFGDGTTSTVQNPQHTYLTSDIFSVSLSVENPAGTDTLEKNDYISSDAQPLAVPDFNSSVTSGIVPLEVVFTDLSSGSVNSWFWNFGDGTNSTEQNPTHTYITQGMYSVVLTVTNYGGSNSTTKADYIQATAQALPVAAFNVSTTSGQAPLSVMFTDESTGAPFISWFWDFGDGTNSTEQNPTHIYTVHGTYDVELTTTNYGGSNSTLTTDPIVVDLQDSPVASFTTNTTSGSTPLCVAFTDTSTGYNITSWFWNFGDGTNSTEQNPVHAYLDGGTFTVSLMVTNDNDSDTATLTDLISASDLHPPTADFSANKTAGKYPLVVQFQDESTSMPKEWLWEFGDGTNSTEQNPVHTYSEIGVYTVTLTVTNDDGVDTMVKDSYIITTKTAEPLPDYNNILVTVANEGGVKYNYFGNNTYQISFQGANRGLNALHISNDPSEPSGQVTASENKSGIFYVTDTGGKGYEDDIILMVAVNDTIPEDFRLHIRADGYTWTPNPDGNSAPDLSSVIYQPFSLNETFTSDDFIYGPHIWKPSGNGFDFPIYSGQNMSETKNTFQMMFIDLNAGVLGRGESLENIGAVRVNYTFENLNTFAAFNAYGYCQNANSGEARIAWTNSLSSGYTVITEDPPIANFSADLTYGVDPFTVQFTDTSTGGTPISWAWDFDNDGLIDSTEPNPVYTYTNVGIYSVNLTVTTSEDESDSLVKKNYISVASAEGALLADSAWPKFGYDAANTGQSPHTGSQNGTVKWTYYTDGGKFTTTSPVSGTDGTIYIVAEDNTLHAVYPNGTQKWQYSHGSGISEGSVAVGADETIYFGSRDSNLYAVNPDGTLKWNYTTEGRIGGSPAIGADGTIYVGGWYLFYALNPDGSLKWSYPTERFYQCCPVLGSDGTIYIGDYGGTVYAFNPDGSLKWNYIVGGAIRGAPSMGSDNTIYVGSDDDSVYALNPNGTLEWTYVANDRVQGSIAVGVDNTVYFGCRDDSVYALNPNGSLKWSCDIGADIRGAPAIGADGMVYIGNDAGLICALDSEGTIKWNYSTGDRIRGSPSIGTDGTVYVGSNDKYLYAFEGTLNFTADLTKGTAPLSVVFTGTSSVDPVSWNWDFGDGTLSSGQNVTKIYSDPGTYTVNLTVTDSYGSNSLVRTDYITVSAPSGPQILPAYNNIFVKVANEAGVKYNAFENDTYNIRFEGVNRGLNALHISTDPAVNFGQVTVSENQSGTFYATDSGGKGYEDEIILMVAVNGTISDDFRLNILSDGYTWTPNPVSNRAPSLDNVTYQPVALNETFTKEDFIYGPQIWKPTGNECDYPIYGGQNLSDTENTFQIMFIDLNSGVLRPNTDLENRGAVRITYTFENLETFAAFNVYGYCQNSNNGDDMVAWSNALTSDKVMSGYSVTGDGSSGPSVASVEITPSSASLKPGENMTFSAEIFDQWGETLPGAVPVWSGSDDTVGVVDAGTGYFEALSPGTVTVTAGCDGVSGSVDVTVVKRTGKTEKTTFDVTNCTFSGDGTGDGKQQMSVNASAATVQNNSIRVRGNGFNLTVFTNTTPVVGADGNINATVDKVVLDTLPVTADLQSPGNVSASISLNLTELPAGAGITTTLSQDVPAATQTAFQLAAKDDGLNLNAVAYTMNIVKTNLTNGQDITDATIRMAVSKTWVAAHGGSASIKIIRFAEDGTKEVLQTRSLGYDGDMELFEAYSPNGLSVFGVAAASAVAAPSTGSSSGGGGSSVGTARVDDIPAGDTGVFAMEETAVYEIDVKAASAIPAMMLTAEEVSLSSDSEKAPNEVYQYIRIQSYLAPQDSMEMATLKFSVDKDWLKSIGSDASAVKVYHYNEESETWELLSTVADGLGESGYTFFADTPSFSLFAITAEKGVAEKTTPVVQPTATGTEIPSVVQQTPTDVSTPEQTSNSSGISIILGILIVVICGGVYRRKKSE